MGIAAGFDMVPRLSKGNVDRHNWDQFIGFIKDHYKDDSQVEIKPNYILFKAGEHPTLPFEGHKFLRFSSKVSGANAARTKVESYINKVTRIAKDHFGSRARYWNECSDQYGEYDWDEVYESLRSYEQVDEKDDKSASQGDKKDDKSVPQVDERMIHTTVASFPSGNDSIKELDIPVFEVKDIPGKGKGLLARLDISEGTRILCEQPLLTAQSMPLRELEVYLAARLKELLKASQRQFLSLHNNFPGKFPFSNTFKTNALPCGPGSAIGGVYPTICLINHSCIPNSHNSWDSKAEHETIYAIRPIKAGEEITISYDRGGTCKVRRAFLREAFGFDCNCRGCSRLPSELRDSDARRLMIQSLDDAIGDPFRMQYMPGESLGNCQLLLQVLEDEFDGYAGVLNARLYYDAFQVSIAHSDQARASVFAERSYQARVICEGEDSPDTQRVKSLALNPTAHHSFGMCSKKWKTKKAMVPKGLGTAPLQEWLFAHATHHRSDQKDSDE